MQKSLIDTKKKKRTHAPGSQRSHQKPFLPVERPLGKLPRGKRRLRRRRRILPSSRWVLFAFRKLRSHFVFFLLLLLLRRTHIFLFFKRFKRTQKTTTIQKRSNSSFSQLQLCYTLLLCDDGGGKTSARSARDHVKHREREKKEEFVLVYFFFRAKVKKRRCLDTNFSLSKRTLENVFVYVSINLSHTQINSINTHIILNHNARNCSFIIIFNLPHDE